ncbi:hypothetical protein F5B20DRAFT_566706 [Whalleya microplaca]|nr:hypothetical protein F5B20DRAFT_566706 [Whalleya microplaca]
MASAVDLTGGDKASDSLYWAPAQVLCFGNSTAARNSCQVNHIKLPGSDNIPPLPKSEIPELRGFNELQVGRDQWLNGEAIERSLKAYLRSLPKQLRAKIHIGGTDNDQFFLAGPTGEAAFKSQITRNQNRFFRSFRQTEYSIWPICHMNNHWELAVIHKQKRSNEKDGWTHITEMAVIDPWRGEGYDTRSSLFDKRLKALFDSGNFTFGESYQRSVWVPVQKDYHSCGPRAYWAGRKIMDRLIEFEEVNTGYDESLWDDIGPWFNNDQVRWEMIGLNAYDAIRCMGYKARVAVELVNHMKRLEGGKVVLVDAGVTMRPGDQSEEQLQPRPNPRTRSRPAPPQPVRRGPRPTGSTVEDDKGPSAKRTRTEDDEAPSAKRRRSSKGTTEPEPGQDSAKESAQQNRGQRRNWWRYPSPNEHKIAPEHTVSQDDVRSDSQQTSAATGPVFQPSRFNGRTPLAQRGNIPVIDLTGNSPANNSGSLLNPRSNRRRNLFTGDVQFTPRKAKSLFR